MEAAGDRADEAVEIAARMAAERGLATEPEVLHRSNNVVVRVGYTVFKVGRIGATAMEREVAVAAYGVARGAPVLGPLDEVVVIHPWIVSIWPFVRSAGPPRPAHVAAALRGFHAAMASCPVEIPLVADVLRRSAGLAEDPVALSALDNSNRALLAKALRRVARDVDDVPCVVVHGEPHDGNLIARGHDVVLIDLESTKRAPVEWDLAVRPRGEVEDFWPMADQRLLELLRLGVSAQVATYCWRHVSARPHDDDVRRHANHHLERVAASL